MAACTGARQIGAHRPGPGVWCGGCRALSRSRTLSTVIAPIPLTAPPLHVCYCLVGHSVARAKEAPVPGQRKGKLCIFSVLVLSVTLFFRLFSLSSQYVCGLAHLTAISFLVKSGLFLPFPCARIRVHCYEDNLSNRRPEGCRQGRYICSSSPAEPGP